MHVSGQQRDSYCHSTCGPVGGTTILAAAGEYLAKKLVRVKAPEGQVRVMECLEIGEMWLGRIG